MAEVTVRQARPDDVAAVLNVLRRSITELCTADHHDDPEVLARWLRNKTPEAFASWLNDPDGVLLVAEHGGAVRAVSSLQRSGKINLCYVEPGFEGFGLGGALMASMEQQAQIWALGELRLESTLAARPFYERLGFVADGEPACGVGSLRCYPYRKQLGRAER
jgi:GNAT superfamily N-acetyltransferase